MPDIRLLKKASSSLIELWKVSDDKPGYFFKWPKLENIILVWPLVLGICYLKAAAAATTTTTATTTKTIHFTNILKVYLEMYSRNLAKSFFLSLFCPKV